MLHTPTQVEHEMDHPAQHVAAMVLALHSPQTRDAAEIRRLDDALSNIQLHWPFETRLAYGRELLSHPDSIVRFFAAGVLSTVAGSPIGKGVAHLLQDDYMNYLQHGIQQKFGPMEMRKLCEAVAILYCNEGWSDFFNVFLQRCISPLASTQDATQWEHVLADTDTFSLRSAHMLIDALTERTSKLWRVGNASTKDVVYEDYARMSPQLLMFLWATIPRREMFADYESALAVASRLLDNPCLKGKDFVDSAKREVFHRSLHLLTQDIGPQISHVASVVDTVLTSNAKFITDDIWHGLLEFCGNTNSGCLMSIAKARNEGDDVLLAGAQDLLLSVAFHALGKEDMLENMAAFPTWLHMLEALVNEFGREDEDDDIKSFSTRLLGFWTEFAETCGQVNETSPIQSRELMKDVISAAAFRITSGFSQPFWCEPGPSREEVKETLESIYDFFQQRVASKSEANRLLSIIVLAKTDGQITQTAQLAGFVAVAEMVWKEPGHDQIVVPIVEKILASGTAGLQLAEPSETVRFLAAYGAVLSRHTELLLPTLQYVFTMLRSGIGDLVPLACEALTSIFGRNSQTVVTYVVELLQEYSVLRSSPSLPLELRYRLIVPFASMAESADRRAETRENMGVIISFIELDVSELTPGHTESIDLTGALEIIRTIQRIGQVTGRGPVKGEIISLDEDDDDKAELRFQHAEQELQQRLSRCIAQLLNAPGAGDSAEVLHEICHVFEIQAKPFGSPIFAFSAQLHTELLEACLAKELACDAALSSYASMIHNRRQIGDPQFNALAFRSLELVISYIGHNRDSNGDPEALTSAVQLLQTYVASYSGLVRRTIDTFSLVLHHLTRVIVFPESLPKAAICNLWLELLNAGSGLQAGLNEQHLQSLIENICAQVAGAALKQDLERLSALTCKLVVSNSTAQAIFTNAFDKMANQGQERLLGSDRFVRQIFMLRGNREKTYEVIKGFWEQCQRDVAVTEQYDDDDEAVEIVALF